MTKNTRLYNLHVKKAFLLAFSMILLAVAQAQSGRITGRVADEKSAALPFANIALMQPGNKTLVAGAVTDSSGVFSLATPAAGKYFLRITAIGFAEQQTEVFDVASPDYTKDFGNIGLKSESKTLQEVSITALRPTITMKADRMVVSVEGTAMAAGTNAYSVLAKAPGVFIDPEGNIQLNGRSGVTVMIDGRLTFLSARDLRSMLEGMSAENLKNIEIITNPSAKYDAEGTSGILNINLKKNTQRGMNGSLYAGWTWNFQQHGYSYGGNINFKGGRWNSFLNLDAARRVGGREATFTRIFYGTNRTTYFDQWAIGNWVAEGPPAARFGTDYSFNDRHSVGFTAYYNTNMAESEFLTDTWIGNNPKVPYQFIDADNFSRNTFTSRTGNLHYTGKLDTNGRQLTADLDFARITNRGSSDFYNYFTDLANDTRTSDQLYTHTPNGYDIFSGRIDYIHPVAKEHKLETGLRVSRVHSDNDFRFYFNNGSMVLDPLRTNHFDYLEHIYAGYLNWHGPISKKLSVQAGLRAEQTVSTGTSFTTGQVTGRKYLNLFPSVFVQQKVSENYGINWSYSRRLTRPNYGNLNPFRAYRDPYTWVEGNPFLRPQYTHSFSIAQSIKKIYIMTVSYNFSTDVMAEIPILDVAKNVTIYTTGNVDDGHSIAFTGVAPLKITKNWDTQNTTVLSYNKFSMMSNNGLVVNDQLFFMFQSNHTIQLPKELRMELNLLYRGPAASGLYHMASMHRVDVAFKRSFFNRKFDISVNGNDLFKGFRYLWSTNINGNVNDFNQYFRFRSMGVTLRYNFKKGQKVEQKRRNNTVEELNRT